MGKDRVLHTAVAMGKKRGDFMTFCSMEAFLQGHEDVTVITTSLWFLTSEQLQNHAREVSRQEYEYSLSNNNCEHLAFQAASGFKICTSLQNSLYFSVAVVADFLRNQHCKIASRRQKK